MDNKQDVKKLFNPKRTIFFIAGYSITGQKTDGVFNMLDISKNAEDLYNNFVLVDTNEFELIEDQKPEISLSEIPVDLNGFFDAFCDAFCDASGNALARDLNPMEVGLITTIIQSPASERKAFKSKYFDLRNFIIHFVLQAGVNNFTIAEVLKTLYSQNFILVPYESIRFRLLVIDSLFRCILGQYRGKYRRITENNNEIKNPLCLKKVARR